MCYILFIERRKKMHNNTINKKKTCQQALLRIHTLRSQSAENLLAFFNNIHIYIFRNQFKFRLSFYFIKKIQVLTYLLKSRGKSFKIEFQ